MSGSISIPRGAASAPVAASPTRSSLTSCAPAISPRSPLALLELLEALALAAPRLRGRAVLAVGAAGHAARDAVVAQSAAAHRRLHLRRHDRLHAAPRR